MEIRTLPELSAAADGTAEDEAHVPTIQPSERHNDGLRKYTKNQLIAWLTDKLGAPVATEVKDTREPLVACVSAVLEIMEREGASHFQSMRATMGALHNWTVDVGNFERLIDQGITDPAEVYDFLKQRLPVIERH